MNNLQTNRFCEHFLHVILILLVFYSKNASENIQYDICLQNIHSLFTHTFVLLIKG